MKDMLKLNCDLQGTLLMKISALLILFFSGYTALEASQVPFIGAPLSALIGTLIHPFAESDMQPLKPQHEEMVRSIARQMGITQKFSIHRCSFLVDSPKCSGDRLYFSDSLFERWKQEPEVLKYVIGHELGHLENQHAVKLLLKVVLPTVVFLHLAIRYIDATALGKNFNAWTAQQVGSLVPYAHTALGNSIKTCVQKILYSAGSLGNLVGWGTMAIPVYAFYAQKQAHEYEADLFSLKRLEKTTNKDLLIRAMGRYFSKELSFKRHSWVRTHFADHPHSRLRLLALSFPQDESEDAGKKMITLLKKYFIEYLFPNETKLLSCTASDLRGYANLCSIHKTIAEKYRVILEEVADVLDKLCDCVERSQGYDLDASILQIFEAEQQEALRMLCDRGLPTSFPVSVQEIRTKIRSLCLDLQDRLA
jgi:hypothetical protein